MIYSKVPLHISVFSLLISMSPSLLNIEKSFPGGWNCFLWEHLWGFFVSLQRTQVLFLGHHIKLVLSCICLLSLISAQPYYQGSRYMFFSLYEEWFGEFFSSATSVLHLCAVVCVQWWEALWESVSAAWWLGYKTSSNFTLGSDARGYRTGLACRHLHSSGKAVEVIWACWL